jgi:hypothetical protein
LPTATTGESAERVNQAALAEAAKAKGWEETPAPPQSGRAPSQTFGQRMNSEPKHKRDRFQQLTQNPKVKTGKAFAADLRKSNMHPTVKKLTAWRKLNRLSQRKAVAVLAQYYYFLLPIFLSQDLRWNRRPISTSRGLAGRMSRLPR